MEEPVVNSDIKESNSVSSKPALLASSPFKAKRSVSFKDKDPKQSLHTVHHVESLKSYNSTEEKGFSCLKCCVF